MKEIQVLHCFPPLEATPGPQIEFEDTVVGVFERGNPWSSGYSTMDDVKSEL